MMRDKSVSICNRCLARLVHSSRNRAFWRGYPNLMHLYGGLLEPRGSKLTPLKSTFNAENFIPRLSWSIFNDFGAVHSWNVYRSLKAHIVKKSLQTPILGVQGRSRSSMLVAPESSSAVLVMKTVSLCICSRSHARRANSGKEQFLRGTHLWCPCLRGPYSPSGTKFARKKLGTLRYDMVQIRSLYLTWAWIGTGSWRTDGQTVGRTDIITIASMHYVLSRVKEGGERLKSGLRLQPHY